jgi:hypothetical protein
VKTAERLEARRLRAAEGCSIREIAQRVGVSRSSASLWVRDVELTPPQVDALRGRDPRCLPYGTCLLAVHDTWLVHVIYGSIQELAGFTRPARLEL